MYLGRLETKNYRNLRGFECKFASGLNVLVGENNAGKTNILDAIRLPLGAGYGPRDIWPQPADISHSIPGIREADYFEITLTFEDLSDNERGMFHECLSPSQGANTAQIHYRFEYQVTDKGDESKKVKVWGGDKEVGSLGLDVLDNLRLVFLPALRDAEADLRPGRSSRMGRLLTEVSDTDQERESLEKLLREANEKIRKEPLVERAITLVNKNLKEITGPNLAQTADIGLAEPTFQRIAGTMRALVGHSAVSELEENGLGYNNLLYIATVMSELRRAKERANPTVDLPLLLIEEPEAHLHPQLQILLAEYLNMEANGPVQVIVTSHSPTLVAKVPPSSIAVMHKGKIDPNKGVPIVRSLRDFGLDVSELGDIRRYLDTTKSSLFFARGVILVEGIAEALVLPRLARLLGHNLDQLGISVINLNGLTFSTFGQLFCKDNLEIPCSIITDGDPTLTEAEKKELLAGTMQPQVADAICYPSAVGRISDTARKLQANASGMAAVFLSAKTFEWDLALADNASRLAEVYSELHRIAGPKVVKQIEMCTTPVEKARVFFDSFSEKDKGRYAQRLAARLDEGLTLSVPGYIRSAIEHVIQGIDR